MSRFSKIHRPNEAALRPSIRVSVCVPTGDTVAASFAYDLARMMAWTASKHREIELRLVFNKGTILPEQRHDLVMQSLDAEATHVLFLDSDMRFPKDTLVRLLERGVDVVAANYTRRRFPVMPVAAGDKGEPIYTESDSTGLASVATVGMGVMLISTHLFEEIPTPWFAIGWSPSQQGYAGEDAYFCERVWAHESQVFVDQDLSREVRHLGEWEYSSEHALQTRELLTEAKSDVA